MHRTIVLLVAGQVLTLSGPASVAGSQAGARYPAERSSYRDAVTGRQVIRLTTAPSEDVKIYQTHPSWTADGRWIVFHSDRTGSPQLFAVHEEQGAIVQLTDEPGVNVGQVCLSRRNPTLVTMVGNELVRLDFGPSLKLVAASGPATPPKRSVLGRIPDGAALSGSMSWSASETALYVGLSHAGQPKTRAWSIAKFELDQGAWNTILWPGFRVGHVQANPWRDELIMYCQETGGDAPQRMWVVHADGTGNRPFYRESFDEWVTHELWWDATRALFTV